MVLLPYKWKVPPSKTQYWNVLVHSTIEFFKTLLDNDKKWVSMHKFQLFKQQKEANCSKFLRIASNLKAPFSLIPFCFLRILSTRARICWYSSHSFPGFGVGLLHSESMKNQNIRQIQFKHFVLFTIKGGSCVALQL